MTMNWLESVLFGFVSGLAEFFPVSAQAHQTMFLKLFGATTGPLVQLMIHAALVLGLYQECAQQISALLREQRMLRVPRSRRKRQPDMVKILDMRLLRTASIVLLLGFVAYPRMSAWREDLHFIAPVLIINGILLYIPMHMSTGNKDSRSMSQLDSVLLGLAGAFAVIPGISRVGMVIAAGVVRGADREQSLNWSLLMSIPALICLMGFDVYSIMMEGIGVLSLPILLQIALISAAAYAGARISIRVMRFMAVQMGYSGFSYYCWGAALFCFIMYLTV